MEKIKKRLYQRQVRLNVILPLQSDLYHRLRRHQDPMVKFCAAIQHYSPMNSFVDPIPYHQDGYEDDVVMASGSF